MKQGCVLSLGLFSATLEWALRGWKNTSQGAGIDLRDGLPNLMELRFADDILLFANSGPEAAQLLGKLIVAVGRDGLILNAEKSIVLTNQPQPPPTLVIRDDVVVKVLDRNRGQKWLGCMLTAAGGMRQDVGILYHIEQGTQCFHSKRWILQNRKTSVLSRLKYFDSVVSSTVCFASGHRTINKDHLLRLDVSFRKLCRAIVAPPSETDWSLEWHDIPHNWKIRVQDFASAAAIKPWSRIVCKQHWGLFCYVAHLPEHRWVRGMLAWNPAVRTRQVGRPRHTWAQKVTAFCRYKQLGHWLDCARDEEAWLALFDSFYDFCMA